jgi:hypothetical protein
MMNYVQGLRQSMYIQLIKIGKLCSESHVSIDGKSILLLVPECLYLFLRMPRETLKFEYPDRYYLVTNLDRV